MSTMASISKPTPTMVRKAKKVMATGGNMTPTSDPMRAQYDASTLALIADMGRAAGKHAAAHVLSRSALPDVELTVLEPHLRGAELVFRVRGVCAQGSLVVHQRRVVILHRLGFLGCLEV